MKKILVVIALGIVLLGLSSRSQAFFVDSFIGWNFVGGSGPVAGLSEAVLLDIEYSGASGLVMVPMPAFPSYTGMPDGSGLVATPTYTTTPGTGDGETTSTIGATVPIDWGATASPYPDILISKFVFEVTGLGVFTADFGPSAATWYAVGLIPPGTDTELCSMLFTPQGDIYDGLACITGNPVGTATIVGDPTPGQIYDGESIQVIFAASSAVPLPASAGLFAVAIFSLFGLTRRG